MNSTKVRNDQSNLLYINSFLIDCIDQAERDPVFFEALSPIFKKIAAWIDPAAVAKKASVDNASINHAVALTQPESQGDALLSALRRDLQVVRDLFEPPPVGSELEGLWLEAMSDFSVIPDYIRAQLHAHGIQVNDGLVATERQRQR